MKSLVVWAALPGPWVAAFAFNTYDLGLHGLYPRQHFHSVDLEPLRPVITQWDSRCDNGKLFFTVRGPSVQGPARGPVITDAQGELLNSHYEVAHRITPIGKGLKGDSHEFRITPQGTALIVIYQKIQTDCTDLHLGKRCWIQDGWIQEIDIETGELRFEWRATDHIKMSDVFSAPSRKDGYGRSQHDAFDFFHINSVDKMASGDFIVSARYLHAVICISAETGEIRWQLGGKNNAFQDLNGATDFSWQHHVTWLGNDTISLYDNHANNVFHSRREHSKGMIIQLDLAHMTAALRHTYVHPDHVLNVSQGSVQVVNETGNVLVGFGNSPTYVEYTAQGEVLCQAHFAPHLTFELLDLGLAKSYRIFKHARSRALDLAHMTAALRHTYVHPDHVLNVSQGSVQVVNETGNVLVGFGNSPTYVEYTAQGEHAWVGRPQTRPDVQVTRGRIYVSWNGATEVTGWRLESAPATEELGGEFATVQEMKREGFESSFALTRAQKLGWAGMWM
ncbi:hypothetical protein BUE80_DR007134 [Diplocarpon rosae]|nr:hypothetical protein BUE80_DR007134 [Diplocarpon rosae]